MKAHVLSVKVNKATHQARHVEGLGLTSGAFYLKIQTSLFVKVSTLAT